MQVSRERGATGGGTTGGNCAKGLVTETRAVRFSIPAGSLAPSNLDISLELFHHPYVSSARAKTVEEDEAAVG